MLCSAPGLGLHFWTGGGGHILFETPELNAAFPNLNYKKNMLAMFGHHQSSEETMQGWEREGIAQRNKVEALTNGALRGITQQVGGRRCPSTVRELSGDAWKAFLCMEEAEQGGLVAMGLSLSIISAAVRRADEKRKFGPIPENAAQIFLEARAKFGDFGGRVEARIYIPGWIERARVALETLQLPTTDKNLLLLTVEGHADQALVTAASTLSLTTTQLAASSGAATLAKNPSGALAAAKTLVISTSQLAASKGGGALAKNPYGALAAAKTLGITTAQLATSNGTSALIKNPSPAILVATTLDITTAQAAAIHNISHLMKMIGLIVEPSLMKTKRSRTLSNSSSSEKSSSSKKKKP